LSARSANWENKKKSELVRKKENKKDNRKRKKENPPRHIPVFQGVMLRGMFCHGQRLLFQRCFKEMGSTVLIRDS
jgi:hypothetical protein